ncbi:MAG: hypothetical protein K2M04_01695 [Muribaculaceae bacterium]|nr:hypothetical protein [Muribaculaceae bacterium]
MNLTLPLQDLVARLAIATGASADTSSQFIREYFALIAETLARGERVNVDGLGSFAPDELRPGQVIFEPAQSLAEAINQPFECFDPIELPDEVPDVSVNSIEEASSPERASASGYPPLLPDIPLPASASTPVSDPVPSSEQLPDSEPLPDPAPSPAPEPVTVPVPDSNPDPESEPTPALVTISQQDPVDVNIPTPLQVEILNHHPLHCRLRTAMALLIGLILGLVIGFLLCWSFGFDIFGSHFRNVGVIGGADGPTAIFVATPDDIVASVDSLPATQASVMDSSADSAPSSVDQPIVATPVITDTLSVPVATSNVVTDTVRPGRFLTTMARRHYGSYEFWVYIYQENASRLSHPDRIPVGTVVVIPDRSRYDIDPASTESIARARRLSREIYSRFD